MINKKSLFSAIMIIAILLSVSTVIAANDNDTVYVSTTGNDANLGTSDSPFKTIAKAVEVAPNGGTVFIKAGTYLGGEGNRDITINKNLTIKGEDKATTIIDGSTGVGKQIFDIALSDYPIAKVTIQGLTFKNFANGPRTIRVAAGVYNSVENDGKLNNLINIIIEDSDFINNSGISLDLSSYHVLPIVRNCNFINNYGPCSGAAINVDGDFFVSNSTFINNTASSNGGAIKGTVTSGINAAKIIDSKFSGNKSPIFNDIYMGMGMLSIYNTIFDPVTVDSQGNSKPSVGHGAGNHIYVDGVEI
jgi:predicted outer membrane repeat protein